MGVSWPVSSRNMDVGIVFIVICKEKEMLYCSFSQSPAKKQKGSNNSHIKRRPLTSPTDVARRLTILSCGTATTLWPLISMMRWPTRTPPRSAMPPRKRLQIWKREKSSYVSLKTLESVINLNRQLMNYALGERKQKRVKGEKDSTTKEKMLLRGLPLPSPLQFER